MNKTLAKSEESLIKIAAKLTQFLPLADFPFYSWFATSRIHHSWRVMQPSDYYAVFLCCPVNIIATPRVRIAAIVHVHSVTARRQLMHPMNLKCSWWRIGPFLLLSAELTLMPLIFLALGFVLRLITNEGSLIEWTRCGEGGRVRGEMRTPVDEWLPLWYSWVSSAAISEQRSLVDQSSLVFCRLESNEAF